MDRRLFIIYVLAMIDMMGYGIVIPLIPYYASALSASPIEISLIIAAFPCAQILGSLILSSLSDLLGRRFIIICSLLFSSISYLIFATAHSVAMLMIARLIAGIGGGTIPVAQAYIVDITTSQQRTLSLGHLGAANSIGIILGPIISGLFLPYGIQAPGLIATILCFSNMIAAILFLKNPPVQYQAPNPKQTQKLPYTLSHLQIIFKNPFQQLIAIYVLAISASEAIQSILILYLYHTIQLSAIMAARLWVCLGVINFVFRFAISQYLLKICSDKTMIYMGLTVFSLSAISLIFTSNINMAFLCISLFAIGASLTFPSLSSITASSAGYQISHAALMSLVFMAGCIGKLIIPIMSGFLFQKFSFSAPLWMSLLLFILTLIFSLRYLPAIHSGLIQAHEIKP